MQVIPTGTLWKACRNVTASSRNASDSSSRSSMDFPQECNGFQQERKGFQQQELHGIPAGIPQGGRTGLGFFFCWLVVLSLFYCHPPPPQCLEDCWLLLECVFCCFVITSCSCGFSQAPVRIESMDGGNVATGSSGLNSTVAA